MCVKLVIYKDHTRMNGQQNIKCFTSFRNTVIMLKFSILVSRR